jgi:hypothetical protein
MKKYLFLSLSLTLLFTFVFFLIPINLFEGEIVFKIGENEVKETAKISLSYFIGIGAGPKETEGVLDFYLLPLGYFNAFLILIALPILISYRFFLSNEKKKVT